MTAAYERGGVRLYCGDMREVCPQLDVQASAVVCDPPYGLDFMGKAWDHGVPGVEFWEVALAAALPGAHLLAFGGTRTEHRLVCAIEDAGWEIRDKLMWLYGQGFPKSHDVSKAIDKAAGAEREVVGRRVTAAGQGRTGAANYTPAEPVVDVTAPRTSSASAWSGWGTALKPAWEPICLARKPLGERTVAANVLAHGTGAINVDGCRVETNGRPHLEGLAIGYGGQGHSRAIGTTTQGRWPANLVLSHLAECERVGSKRVASSMHRKPGQPLVHHAEVSGYGGQWGDAEFDRCYSDPDGLETVEAWRCAEGCPVRMLDDQSGELTTHAGTYRNASTGGQIQNAPRRKAGDVVSAGDTGGASRFFYCAKASRRERNAGCDDIEGGNSHPTVKPVKLMGYLVRLVTQPHGTVLDPFCGSGSTILAAIAERRAAIGIDSDPHAIEIAAARCDAALDALDATLPFAEAMG